MCVLGCVCVACMCLCACFCRGDGDHELQWERKRDGRQKSLWGSLSSAGLVSVCTLQKLKRDLFHSPFILLTVGKAHARTRGPAMSWLTYLILRFSKLRRDIPKKRHCVVWMPQAFSISTHMQRWRVSAAVSSGGWRPAKLAAFRLLMHRRTQSHTWVTLVWPWGTVGAHVIFYTLVSYLQSDRVFMKPIRLLWLR